MFDALKKELRSFYLLKDSPQSISIGFGLGVFLGILPFTGFIAAVALAHFFHLNKTAALLGSILTNTWASFVILGVAINLSCIVLGLSGHDIQLRFQNLIKNFHFSNLFDVSVVQIIATVVLGYIIVSFLVSLVAYGICLGIIYWQRRYGSATQ